MQRPLKSNKSPVGVKNPTSIGASILIKLLLKILSPAICVLYRVLFDLSESQIIFLGIFIYHILEKHSTRTGGSISTQTSFNWENIIINSLGYTNYCNIF